MPEGSGPLTPSMPTTVTCPSCGVDVQVGYPRCPRCHAAVPQAPRAKRQTFRESNVAGGTSLEPPAAPGGRTGLLILALAGVAAILLFIWLGTRDTPDRKPTEPAAGVVEDEEDDEEDEEEVDDDEGAAPDDDDRPAADQMPAALRDLDEALRAAQMWSKVTREGDVVVVESALCEDKGMWAAIAPLAVQLRDAGASAVRCRAQHGAVVFEHDL
jgi:hypothetical protein